MAFARTTALEFLRRAYEQDRLAHAYLITGAPGSGKEVLAAELASLVNGTPAKDVFSAKAREVFIARPESKSRRIVTAQIRALEHALQMRASDGRRKVAIIPDADRLQTEAANAFLKTLGGTAKGFTVASAKRSAGGSSGNGSFAVYRHSTRIRRRDSEQERGGETGESTATSIPPYDLECSICLSTCSGISTTTPSEYVRK